jgi:hypothetical protein
LFRWKRQALVDAGVIEGTPSVEADELAAALAVELKPLDPNMPLIATANGPEGRFTRAQLSPKETIRCTRPGARSGDAAVVMTHVAVGGFIPACHLGAGVTSGATSKVRQPRNVLAATETSHYPLAGMVL